MQDPCTVHIQLGKEVLDHEEYLPATRQRKLHHTYQGNIYICPEESTVDHQVGMICRRSVNDLPEVRTVGNFGGERRGEKQPRQYK